MGFNFPNSPTSGQVFTPAGGPTFVWDGVAWKGSAQGLPIAFISDTPPSNPGQGQLWWESDTGNLFMWYVDADSSQWVQVSGAVSAQPTAETRNRIVNPCFQHSQENGDTGSAASAYFIADQWMTNNNSTTTTAFRTPLATPNGSKYRYQSYVTTADTSLTKYWTLMQAIEGTRMADFQWGTVNAKQAVLRFTARSQNFSGTLGGCIRNAASDRSFVFSYTVTHLVDNVVTIVIPGDTAGVWPTDNSKAAELFFTHAAMSSQLGPVGWGANGNIGPTGLTNGLGTLNDIVFLGDVGLYLDPLNTGVPPAWTMPDEAEELRTCSRYFSYWTSDWQYIYPRATNDTYRMGTVTFPAIMRVSPSVSVIGQFDGGGEQGFTVGYINQRMFHITHNVGNVSTQGIFNRWTANARM